MRYLTDRKRAMGKGAAGAGTLHHWYMQVSAVGLAFLVPAFVFIIGSALGGSRDEVLASLSHPFSAIVIALTLVVGLQHFRKGAQTMIEDYARGKTRKMLIMLTTIFSYGLMATGLYALARIAL